MTSTKNFAEVIKTAINMWNQQKNSRKCISLLSNTLKCSPQAVYKWTNGGTITPDKIAQIYAFFDEINGCDAQFWGVSDEIYTKYLADIKRETELNKLNLVFEFLKNADDAKKNVFYALVTDQKLLQNVSQLVNYQHK